MCLFYVSVVFYMSLFCYITARLHYESDLKNKIVLIGTISHIVTYVHMKFVGMATCSLLKTAVHVHFLMFPALS